MSKMDYFEFSNMIQNVLVEHICLVLGMMPELFKEYMEDDEELSLEGTWGQGEQVEKFRSLFGADDMPPEVLRTPVKRGAKKEKLSAEDYLKILDEDRRTLFEELRALRAEMSREMKIAPYIIFSNRALYEMCEHLPESESEFLDLHGVGKKNAALYGEKFMDAIRKFADQYFYDA